LEDHLGLGEPEPEPESEPEPAIPARRAAASPLSDLDSAFADLTPSEDAPTLASEDAFTDLGAELFGAIAAVEEPAPQSSAESLGDAGLADIFREFKKGVDKQLGQEDYDTRYNLGIAYKEMGLIDEAIAEFQLAAKDPTRLLECSSMLGICFLEKGMPKLAIKWFDKGLTTPGRMAEEYLGLRYDLAAAYEADGDVDHAIGILLDLNTQDPNFRDVASRLRELRALASRS
jgi:tetratricopeptide (TPR) repeat protein